MLSGPVVRGLVLAVIDMGQDLIEFSFHLVQAPPR